MFGKKPKTNEEEKTVEDMSKEELINKLKELEKKPKKEPISEKEEKTEGIWQPRQIPSTYEVMIVNGDTEEILDINGALAKILSNQEIILKALI